MKLLIGNDDGIFAQGLQTLANVLAEAGHEVTVVCPDQERSATGHGLTLHHPIRAEVVGSLFHPAVKAWCCSGTPSDCIKLALGGLVDTPPDFVLAGINHGPNLGTDILYSGTVAAAMEGALEGIPSVAFSLNSFSAQEFGPGAAFARDFLPHLVQHPLPDGLLLNVNIPAVQRERIAGVVLTRQGIRRCHNLFVQRLDPREKPYYWLAAEFLEEADTFSEGATTALPTDLQAIQKNYITITPLQYDLTHNVALGSLQNLQLAEFLEF